MGLSFTSLHFFKTDESLPVDPDTQITEMIKYLDGEIKENWQVIAPTPMTRVIYFELVEGKTKPEFVHGSLEEMREAATGKKKVKRIKKK